MSGGSAPGLDEGTLPQTLDNAVLLLLPFGRDAKLAADALGAAGLEAVVCSGAGALAAGLARGAGVAVVAEEALPPDWSGLDAVLKGLPSWSSPSLLVLLCRDGPLPRSLPVLRAMEAHPRMQATFLRRPVPALSLVSTVRAALHARLRQYQLRDLLSRLERDVKRRDDFLAMLGHELRNPVSSIAYMAEMFQTAGADLSPEVATRGAAVIIRQVRHLARLLDELLDVARIQSGKIALRKEPLDLRSVVEQTMETFREAAKKRRFERVVPDVPVVVIGDRVRLTQVVNNLVDNALKYTREGGCIRLELAVGDGVARVSVEDDGIGISEKGLREIFKPFYQDFGARSGGVQGLGLGLAMVDSLVRLHGGTVTARSDGEGRGARFDVTLPLAQPSVRPEVAAPPAAAARQRLLIVEDNAEVADLFALLLKSLGHEAHVAYAGQHGVSLAATLEPDMVFIDIGLPDISGHEVARRIRALLGDRAPPLVALSGYPPSERTGDGGLFRDYVLKPIDRERIARLFETAGGA
ncbi:MAG TPA: hybrid sensor histidine kinase/response regulator [Gammaproteobacteria bacterium]